MLTTYLSIQDPGYLKRRYESLIFQSQDYEREVQSREIEVNNYNRLRNDNVRKVQDLKMYFNIIK